MFEAISSVLDALVQASRPRTLNAWLLLVFTLGLIWYVAAGIMNGATDPVALAGGLCGIVALLIVVVRSVFAVKRERSSS